MEVEPRAVTDGVDVLTRQTEREREKYVGYS